MGLTRTMPPIGMRAAGAVEAGVWHRQRKSSEEISHEFGNVESSS